MPSRRHRLHVAGFPLATLLLVFIAYDLSGCSILPALMPINDHHGPQAVRDGDVLLGAWLGSWPSDGNPAIARFEEKTGIKPDLIDVYMDWQTPVANVTHTMRNISGHGAVAVLTWEPQGFTTVDINKGSKTVPLRDGRRVTLDAYLGEFATGVCDVARETGQPVLVRTLHELNGDWFSWGLSYKSPDGSHPNTVENYRAAWMKIHDAFTTRCGDDVRFVWAINHFSKGPGADFTNAYPGDAAVDYVAIDGYNWGTNAPWGWQGFDTLFHDPYCALARDTQKPILLAEVASSEKGGNKSAWVQDVFRGLSRYPRLNGFVWFDSTKFEIEVHGTVDWAIDSSPAAVAAYHDGAAQMLAQREGTATGSTAVGAGTPVHC